MGNRRVYDDELHAHFVTFSCRRRRRLLDHDRAKKIVLAALNHQRAKQKARCVGFVVMPDHVHLVVWFPLPKQLSYFVQQWKQRSSLHLKAFLLEHMPTYAKQIDTAEGCWERKFYPFNLYIEKKVREKLEYMHLNPVRKGLVEKAVDWPWSSARYYELGRSVGVPIEWIG